MSSSAGIRFDDGEGIELDEWLEFCKEWDITYSPHTVGRNTFYAGQVECHFGEPVWEELPKLPGGGLDFSAAQPRGYVEVVRFSTYHFGSYMPKAANLAAAFWLGHGGWLNADPEIRAMMLGRL